MSDETSSETETYDNANSCGTASTSAQSIPYVDPLPDINSHSFENEGRPRSGTHSLTKKASRNMGLAVHSYFKSNPLAPICEEPYDTPRSSYKNLWDNSDDKTSPTQSVKSSFESSLDIFSDSTNNSHEGRPKDGTHSLTKKASRNMGLAFHSYFKSDVREPPYNTPRSRYKHLWDNSDDITSLTLSMESFESSLGISSNSTNNGQEIDIPNQYEYEPIASPVHDSTPRKTYQKLWDGLASDPKKGIISLLKDYTKGNNKIISPISLFIHGHPNRHYTKDVRNLLQKEREKSAQEIINDLQTLLNKHPHNPQCSLQKRLDFIRSQAPELFTSEPKPGM